MKLLPLKVFAILLFFFELANIIFLVNEESIVDPGTAELSAGALSLYAQFLLRVAALAASAGIFLGYRLAFAVYVIGGALSLVIIQAHSLYVAGTLGPVRILSWAPPLAAGSIGLLYRNSLKPILPQASPGS